MINVNAAIFKTKNRMGLGFDIKNHRGDFFATVRQGFDKITNLEMAETIAFRRRQLLSGVLSSLPYNSHTIRWLLIAFR
jgi:hypothetical protein